MATHAATTTLSWRLFGRRQVRGRIFSVVLALLLGVLPFKAPADVSLRWQSDGAQLSPLLADYLADSNIVADFVRVINDNFEFEPSLVIDLGAGDTPGYDALTNTIRMPYAYLERAVITQSELVEPEQAETAVERALDVVEYTLYHLLGHSFAGTGDETADDTAEALSTYIMVAYWPSGAEQWAAAVRAFGAASQKLDGPLTDFWHSHALYKIRQQTIECWIMGSQTARQIDDPMTLWDESLNPEVCEASWDNLESTALALLDLYLLPDAPILQSAERGPSERSPSETEDAQQ